jgi:predicted small lipoprotein YifL
MVRKLHTGNGDTREAAAPRSVTVLIGAIVVVLMLSGSIAGCRGKNPAEFAKSIDDIAKLVAGRTAKQNPEAAVDEFMIQMRVRSVLKPVEKLAPKDREEAIEYACSAKDVYDLTNPDEREQAAADYHAYGIHAGAIRGLLREFGELARKPSVSGGVNVTTGAVCAAA